MPQEPLTKGPAVSQIGELDIHEGTPKGVGILMHPCSAAVCGLVNTGMVSEWMVAADTPTPVLIDKGDPPEIYVGWNELPGSSAVGGMKEVFRPDYDPASRCVNKLDLLNVVSLWQGILPLP